MVCFSPDLGSTMNQVSCFFPENENTFSLSCSPAVRPQEPPARLPPVPALHGHTFPEVPVQPLLLPPPRVRRSGRALRTGVEHAVRTAARRGLDQLRDGERELLQHRRQRGCEVRETPPRAAAFLPSGAGWEGEVPPDSLLLLACLHCSTPAQDGVVGKERLPAVFAPHPLS